MSCKILSNKNITDRAEDIDPWKGTCLACVRSLVQFLTLHGKKKRRSRRKRRSSRSRRRRGRGRERRNTKTLGFALKAVQKLLDLLI